MQGPVSSLRILFTKACDAKSCCSRLSVDTAPASEWRCSRGHALSVSDCHDDQGAGASDTTRISGFVKTQKEKTDGRTARRSRMRKNSSRPEHRIQRGATRGSPGRGKRTPKA
ncbi:hypothetical protein NDU88_009991 [Pleurodeles waltl]|uniref:Uncharacterized protein n=1 Tax=Pleurodeles waltl TaxID=8319 RepID=A0AAV7RXQ2_PLEWA|nr:hypothetical protein NDU88_009991 [Pleurodeles waltl]